jgi:PIN domain nuclease of toxin-antitoxin system
VSSGDAGLLLDTHIWIWHVWADPALDHRFRAAIEDASDRLWLSPISGWEVGRLVAGRRIELEMGVREWVDEAQRSLPAREAPLTREVALRSNEVDLPHRDPADRFLAATALVYGLTLITADQRLLDAGWLPTL